MKFFEIFRKSVNFFESMNKNYMNNGESYRIKDYAYSLDSFHYLIISTINELYHDDLKDIYIKQLPEGRFIKQ